MTTIYVSIVSSAGKIGARLLGISRNYYIYYIIIRGIDGYTNVYRYDGLRNSSLKYSSPIKPFRMGMKIDVIENILK